MMDSLPDPAGLQQPAAELTFVCTSREAPSSILAFAGAHYPPPRSRVESPGFGRRFSAIKHGL